MCALKAKKVFKVRELIAVFLLGGCTPLFSAHMTSVHGNLLARPSYAGTWGRILSKRVTQ